MVHKNKMGTMRFDNRLIERRFYPFSKLKGVEELRVGIYTFGERIRMILSDAFPKEYIIIPNFIPFEKPKFKEPVIAVSGKPVIYKKGLSYDQVFKLIEKGSCEEIEGIYISEFWQMPEYIERVLEFDMRFLHKDEYYTIGDFLVHKTAEVSLKTHFSGWGIVDRGATVKPFVVIDGPTYIGEESLVKPFTYISSSVIGPVCKVSGEISHTIFEGYANKQHSGFIGHSYVGSWVNLGAGVEVSNLKNTYGHVKVYSYEKGELIDTKRQFLGVFAGDHCKVGINTTISTGTVIGIFANITAADSPTPKFIPDFYWTGGKRMHIDKAVEIAIRVMKRRNKRPSKDYIKKIKYWAYQDNVNAR